MLSFESDYTVGAHPAVMKRLLQCSGKHYTGYGTDTLCKSARDKIAASCAAPDAEVFFISGGTLTNTVVISSLLRSYEGVLSADTGHINAHEAGAIEYTGHKVLRLPQHEGKIAPQELSAYLSGFYQDVNHEHMVFPGMVYLSHPTEYGTLYTKAELTRISRICASYQIPLFLDGARLGYALASAQTDVTLPDIAALCDVFYIGGTKVGAFCGEAVVFPRANAPQHFLTSVKQHGAMLAKGWLLGAQFDALFTQDLYYTISRHAIKQAQKLIAIFRDKGYSFFLQSPTNQQFVILENSQLKKLEHSVRVGFWEQPDETHTVVRFATSWATTDEELQELAKLL